MLWGGGLVLRDGRPVVPVTSAAWGATVAAVVGLAYVADSSAAAATSADWARAGSYKVDVGGVCVPVRVGLRPPYDPENLRVRD